MKWDNEEMEKHMKKAFADHAAFAGMDKSESVVVPSAVAMKEPPLFYDVKGGEDKGAAKELEPKKFRLTGKGVSKKLYEAHAAGPSGCKAP